MQSDMFDIDRRNMLGRAMFLLGATTLPLEGVFAAPTEGSRPFLSAPRFALLAAVADTIVPRTDTPGAADVGVPALLDGMLRDWAGPSQKEALIDALDQIDATARKQNGKTFVALDPQSRATLLTAHDIAALKPAIAASAPAAAASPPVVVDPNYGRPRQEPVQTPVQGQAPAKAEKTGESAAAIQGPKVVDPGYQKLKELIVTLYYYSEPALTQELVYEHSPGTWQPSIPITPETRASGGAGLF